MTTYRKIHGRAIKSVSTNLSAPSAEGQIWFNTTDNKFKSVVVGAAWASASPGIYTKNTAGGAGTTTAAVVYGGASSGGTVFHNETVEYDGSGFSVSGNLGTSRQDMGSCGTQTAALAVGGGDPNKAEVEEYNGSTWSEQTNIPTADRGWGSFGIQTAAVMVGAIASPTAKCFEYDGSSWTTGGSLNDGRRLSGMGCGTETAGLVAGGDPNSNKTETYNGTAFATANTLNTGRQQGKMSGPQTLGLCWGGETPSLTTATESFDGTSWTTSPATLATATKNNSGNKDNTSGTSALNVYGNTPSDTSSAEEYNASTNVITAAAWSSGTSLPGVRWNTSGAGTQTAGLIFGGATGPGTPTFLNTTFEYDGSSWTAGGSTPNSSINQFSAGIQTAAIGGGGLASGGSNTAEAYTYNGTSWTGITATPEVTKGAGGAGTSTACLIYGSDTPGPINQDSYSWNGSSWSEEGAMNTSFQNGAAGGPTENTAFKAGSLFSGPETSTNFETYNGSAWTAGPALITTAAQNRGFGSSAECLSIGGNNKITPVERYNGTAWQSSPALATGRKQFASANFTAPGISNGWVGGGADGDASVEHFTEETTSLNIKDLTQSS
jgi:hypothetical protein